MPSTVIGYNERVARGVFRAGKVTQYMCKQWTLASRFVVYLQLIKGLDNGNEMDNNGKKGTKLNNE